MKQFLILFFMLYARFSQAQVLLIPAPDRHFDLYRLNCQKEGYICSTNFLLEQVQIQTTPQFDLLIDELDYSAKEFRDSLAQRILKILKTEMVSTEQVEILLKLLEQVQVFTDAKNIKPVQLIEKKLQDHLRIVQNEELKELPAEFVVVFKKALALKTYHRLQTAFLRLKAEKIEFNRAISSPEFLATNNCQNEILHTSVQNLKWQIDREKACDLTEQFGRVSSSTSDFIKKNKSTLITVGLVAVGAALLLNNYEVQVSF